MSRPSINDLLEQEDNSFENDISMEEPVDEAPESENPLNTANFTEAAEGMCVECIDQEAAIYCEQCLEEYCPVCFQAIHKKGNRKLHKVKYLNEELRKSKEQEMSEDSEDDDSDEEEELTSNTNRPNTNSVIPVVNTDAAWFEDRAKFIPLRLTLEERKYLRLLEASLQVSDYTDKVDVAAFASSKPKRIVQQLKEICAILCGVTASTDFKAGQQMVVNREFAGSAEFFQGVFEIARRYKIMNPEKMRTAYGKMIYLLQDSMLAEIQDLIKFCMGRPVRTVYSYLQEKNCGLLLHDQLIATATKEIIPDGKDRYDIQVEIKQKEKAIKILARKYSSSTISSEEIERCIYSIGDNHSFLRGTRDPIDYMLQYLVTYFSPDKIEEGYSLAISAGVNGARLTHNHARQFHYVKQSLSLWREVAHEMFKLWILAEQDLLESTNVYKLKDTGQGLNRVQSAPRISRAMQNIVHKVQLRVGPDNWVGSSVIHLGDHNVPNALMFIDKYTQIPRILNPVVLALRRLKELMNNDELREYIEGRFGSLDRCKKDILCDFFKYAFDGSGADNFFDAGSCIDGRLTSAWHWCSHIDKKPFYHIFLLTGFTGFDGQF